MKRLISVLVSFIFVFVMLSPFVLNVAAVLSSTEYDFYYYKKGIGMSNYRGDGGFVSIPATYKTLNLLRIDMYAFYNKSNVTGVEIPNTVTALGDSVFEKCINLKSVTISDSVTSFGKRMFFKCFSLEDVVIGSGMKSITGATFAYCNKLRNLTVPESVTYIYDSEFIECPNLTIYGYNDSYAESYAKQHKIAFVSIDPIPEQTTSNTTSSTKAETTAVSTSSDISSSTKAEIPAISNKTSDTRSSELSSLVSNGVASTQEVITSSEDEVSSNENVSNDTSTAESKEISLETSERKNETSLIYYIAIVITMILIGGGAAVFSMKRKQ